MKKENKQNLKIWRSLALMRARNRCEICGQKYGEKLDKNSRPIPLDVHHIIPRECKELSTDYDNAIVLCKLHHRFGTRINPSAHKNPLPFCVELQTKIPNRLSRLWEKYTAICGGKNE